MSREGLPLVAVGVAACAACCVPPVLGALGVTVGLAALGWLVGGSLVAAAVLAVGLAIVHRRRRAAA